MLFHSVKALVGRTPLVELRRTQPPGVRILGKLEMLNPGGSVKDRVALAMLEAASPPPGTVIIEATSGNTGIGLALVCAMMDLECIIVMPDSMSAERVSLIEAYGGRVVLTPGADGMTGAIAKAHALAAEIPQCMIADQFRNPANPMAHYAATGPEIWEDTGGNIDIFVAGVGTGGTLTGVGRYLKERNPGIQIVAVEPAASPLLSQGHSGSHGIQGIGPNFVPAVLDRSLIDAVIPVSVEAARQATQLLAQREGILAGISSGAALHAAIQIAQQSENAGKTIGVLLPDSGERYLSTDLFRDR